MSKFRVSLESAAFATAIIEADTIEEAVAKGDRGEWTDLVIKTDLAAHVTGWVMEKIVPIEEDSIYESTN